MAPVDAEQRRKRNRISARECRKRRKAQRSADLAELTALRRHEVEFAAQAQEWEATIARLQQELHKATHDMAAMSRDNTSLLNQLTALTWCKKGSREDCPDLSASSDGANSLSPAIDRSATSRWHDDLSPIVPVAHGGDGETHLASSPAAEEIEAERDWFEDLLLGGNNEEGSPARSYV